MNREIYKVINCMLMSCDKQRESIANSLDSWELNEIERLKRQKKIHYEENAR